MSTLPAALTFAVIFSLSFFSPTNARIPLTQPSNLLTEYKPSIDEEYKQTINEDDSSIQLIRLPTDKSQPDISESETDIINNIGISRPLTITYDFTLRPINRHFHHLHIRHPIWYHRFPLPCHHHGRHAALDAPREVLVSGSDRAFRVPLKENGVDEEGQAEGVKVDGEKKEGNLLKKVRKFLNQF